MYKCRICRKGFRRLNQLGGRMKNAHPNAPPEELIKQGVEAAQPAEQAALPAKQAAQPAEQPASEAGEARVQR